MCDKKLKTSFLKSPPTPKKKKKKKRDKKLKAI